MASLCLFSHSSALGPSRDNPRSWGKLQDRDGQLCSSPIQDSCSFSVAEAK